MSVRTVPLTLPSDDLTQPRAADVVLIGGGIMGVSIAYHLAAAGVRNIVLVEQFELGSGSSAKPLGGVRANFSDPGNIQLGQRSLERFARFTEDFGTDIELSRVGYLFLARTEEQLAAMEEATARQNSLGVNSRLISPEETGELNPYLNTGALLGASFSPEDGHADPSAVVEGYAVAARRLGVTILPRTEALEVQRAAGEICAVTTNRGCITTDAVICCAGAWSAQIGAQAGVELPVVPVRRMIGLTPQQHAAHPAVPFTLDLGTTFYFHNYRNGLLLGISHQQEPGLNREYSNEWLAEFNAAARICAPQLAEPELASGWAGFYEATPDHNALIGQDSHVAGFFYATGFSGHGFLQGPAVGELITDLYLGRESFMDATQFSADRFMNAESVLHEVNII
ncbi:NAD(P)/FAD-dependent oxidoreductase [Nesterenkonia ebinurensis]|uniref:NAD(P)/FAD-dependent oxidoreductase n=1 Tax=Nesterenkonia ebinurensis TaxID=2608252 RepID=UPI00123DE483|nr:FAD-binding oxidoreductase [Nesterenkonia ebinurensis]